MGPLHINYNVPIDPEMFGPFTLEEAAESYAEQIAEKMEDVILGEYPDAIVTVAVVDRNFAAARGSEAWYTDDEGRRIEAAPAVIERLDGILARNWDTWQRDLEVE